MRAEFHLRAAKLQAFWRGTIARRYVENYFYEATWAAVVVQLSWRGNRSRRALAKLRRQRALEDYLAQEKELDIMEKEEAITWDWMALEKKICVIQALWRGKQATRRYYRAIEEQKRLRREKELEEKRLLLLKLEEKKVRTQKSSPIPRPFSRHLSNAWSGWKS